MVLKNRYCRECKTGTPQKYIGVEIRNTENIELYKGIYCDSIWRVPEPKSPLEHNLTEDKLKKAKLEGM